MLLEVLAIFAYFAAAVSAIMSRKTTKVSIWCLLFAGLAMLFQATALSRTIASDQGLAIGLGHTSSLVSLTICLLALISHIRRPINLLLIMLFPICILTVLMSLLLDSPISDFVSMGIFIHIIVSILAYSLMGLAVLQALILAWQNHRLKHPELSPSSLKLPPLQTIEKLLFSTVMTGQILLTASIISGAIYIEDLFAQHLAHKTILSIVSWVVFAILLWGRFARGWRGNTAVKWVLWGFCVLMVAFFGSKFVLEVVFPPSAS